MHINLANFQADINDNKDKKFQTTPFHKVQSCILGHVNNIPTMQFFTAISRNTSSKSLMLSLTEGIWDF